MAESNMIEYRRTGDVLKDTERIVDAAKNRAYQSVNVILVQRNWLIGRRIAEEELTQNGRAEYGLAIIKSLSKVLRRNTEMVLQRRICITFILFIKSTLRFSTQ